MNGKEENKMATQGLPTLIQVSIDRLISLGYDIKGANDIKIPIRDYINKLYAPVEHFDIEEIQGCFIIKHIIWTKDKIKKLIPLVTICYNKENKTIVSKISSKITTEQAIKFLEDTLKTYKGEK